MQNRTSWANAFRKRRGAAGLPLLLLGLAIAGVGIFLWQQSRSPSTDPATVLVPDGSPADPIGPEPGRLIAPSSEPGIEPVGRIETEILPYREMERSYDGQGEISGEVFPAADMAFPSHWTLRIRPSKFAMGREQAIERDVEMEGNQSTFEVRDLPMAAYTVQAVAENQASVPMEVTLFRVLGGPPNSNKAHSRIMLRFEPFSSARVHVTTLEGAPAPDLPVWLESKKTGQRYEGRTDARGEANIEGLPEAFYRVLLGHPERPLLLGEELTVLRKEPGTWSGSLPKTEMVVLRIVDAASNPLPDAVVTGHGPTAFDLRSDYQGEISLAYLPHGVYQIRSSHAQSEGKGQFTLRVPLPEHLQNPVLVYCHP